MEQAPQVMAKVVGLVLPACLILYLQLAGAVAPMLAVPRREDLVAALVMDQDLEEVVIHHLLHQAKATMVVQLLELAHLYMLVAVVAVQVELVKVQVAAALVAMAALVPSAL